MKTKIQLIDLTTSKISDYPIEANKSIDEIVAELQTIPNGTMIAFIPDQPNEIVVMDCPGGGLAHINVGHEGYQAAMWFNQHNITFLMLKYRFPAELENGPLSDTFTGVRLMNKLFSDYKKKGVMGASVGGYLAANVASEIDKENAPDFQILMYPVISMRDGLTHVPTREKLFGTDLSDDDKIKKSLELNINEKTPQTFLVLAGNDPIVPPTSSCIYCEKLIKKDKSVSLHLYPEGGHSFGFNEFTYKKVWLEELEVWISALN